MAKFQPEPCDPIVGDEVHETNVVDFGAKGDWNTNGTDDTAAFELAIAAAPDGGVVTIPPGHYGLDNLRILDKSIDLVGHGAWCVQLSDAPAVQFDVTWVPVPIISITEITTPLFGDLLNPETVTDIVVGAIPAGLEPRCRIKIIADDEIPGSNPTSSGQLRRVGEFATVYEIIGNTIRLGHTLTEPFTINPRLAVVPGRRCRIEGINFRPDPAGEAAIWNQSLVQINGYTDPKVERVKIEGAFSFGLEINGCEGAMVDSLTARNVNNNRDNFQFGYGVTLNSSENCSVTNSHFFDTRHGFTTDTQAQPAGSLNFAEQGRTKYVSVTNCTGNNCTNAAFDSHAPAYGITFDGCIAAHEVRYSGSTGAGFQLRGQYITMTNCQALNCFRGIILKNSGVPEGCRDILISNCYVYNAEKYAFDSDGKAGADNPIDNVRIEGGYYHSTGFDEVMKIIQSNVKMVGVEMVGGPLAASNSACLVRIQDGSELEAFTCQFDTRGFTGANPRAIQVREDDCFAYIYDSRFYLNPGQVVFRGPSFVPGVAGQIDAKGLTFYKNQIPLPAEIKGTSIFIGPNTNLVEYWDGNTGTRVVV